MSRRYLLLAAGILAAAVLLALIGPPRPGRRAEVAGETAMSPAFDLSLVLENGHLTPELASVPKGSRVRLRVENRGRVSTRLTLAGYEDALVIPALAPGESWSGSFAADRPGEDFAWLVDGSPAARLAVTGSHLVEGHR